MSKRKHSSGKKAIEKFFKTINEDKGEKLSKLSKRRKVKESKEQKVLEDVLHSPQGDKKNLEWQSKNATYLAEVEAVSITIAKNIMKLLDDGNTTPFIARYRKDEVGNLEPWRLRKLKDSYEYIKKVNEKSTELIKKISGSQIPESTNISLLHSIQMAKSFEELDFYATSFKKKSRGTLAARARALDLEHIAYTILNGTHLVNIEEYVDIGTSGLENATEVISGIQHIIADVISKDPEIQKCLNKIVNSGCAILHSKKRKEAEEKTNHISKYEIYINFSQEVKYIKPHQILAIFRGESDKELSVKIEIPVREWTQLKVCCQKKWIDSGQNYELRKTVIMNSVDDCIKRLIGPFAMRRVKAKLRKEAEEEAINIFGNNLKQLLLTPPCKGKIVMGIDPGFRHGCKVAVISRQGMPLACTRLYLPYKEKKENGVSEKFESKLKELVLKFECETIALGNGVGCRQTEAYLAKLLESKHFEPLKVSYAIVSEQGVSIYSCSPEASEEFPNLDPVYISAVSLARRLQDPLSELVKVEPKHLGVGLYQHDVKSELLNSALDDIVTECVSFVGVDLNTASYYLLKRVAGLSAAKAKSIIRHREENVAFRTLDDLKKVKGIGEKTFVQCAGFLRIVTSTCGWKVNPLDQTPIHPESYDTATSFAEIMGVDLKELGSEQFIATIQSKLEKMSLTKLAKKVGGSLSEVSLIADTFTKPVDHDIRNSMKGPLFKKEFIKLDDLNMGQELTGIVKNVVPFGAFVDIGVGIDGLIHSSKMNNSVLLLNDKVIIKVVSIEPQRKRIGLALLEKIS